MGGSASTMEEEEERRRRAMEELLRRAVEERRRREEEERRRAMEEEERRRRAMEELLRREMTEHLLGICHSSLVFHQSSLAMEERRRRVIHHSPLEEEERLRREEKEKRPLEMGVPRLREMTERLRVRLQPPPSRLSKLMLPDSPVKLSSSLEFLPPSMPPDSPVKLSSSLEFLPPNMSELRVVLLGNSWSERSSVGNFILGENTFNTEEEPERCLRVRGLIKDKEIVLINTPDLLHPNISEDKLREHVGTCVSLSDPGPHVLLLVLQPEDFTEEHRQRLCRVLELFSDRPFHHSLVLISSPREEQPGFMEKYRQHPPVKEMIRMSKYRFLWRKDLELQELLTRFGQIVKENDGEHLKC